MPRRFIFESDPEATRVDIPIRAPVPPTIGQQPTELIPEQTFGIQPDLFTMENPEFYEQSQATQRRARLMFGAFPEEAKAEGLEPPTLPHGRIAGAIQALGQGLSLTPEQPPPVAGESPLISGAAGLAGEVRPALDAIDEVARQVVWAAFQQPRDALERVLVFVSDPIHVVCDSADFSASP